MRLGLGSSSFSRVKSVLAACLLSPVFKIAIPGSLIITKVMLDDEYRTDKSLTLTLVCSNKNDSMIQSLRSLHDAINFHFFGARYFKT